MIAQFKSFLAAAEVLEGFQILLRRCPTASDRKSLIMAAHGHGGLTEDETGLLITALGLETA